jgi:hypothetical protein
LVKLYHEVHIYTQGKIFVEDDISAYEYSKFRVRKCSALSQQVSNIFSCIITKCNISLHEKNIDQIKISEVQYNVKFCCMFRVQSLKVVVSSPLSNQETRLDSLPRVLQE